MKRELLVVSVALVAFCALVMGASFYDDYAPSSGTGIDTVISYNSDTVSKRAATTIPVVDKQTSQTKYTKLAYQFIFPTAIAAAAGSPGGLGNRDTAKVILEGVTKEGVIIPVRTDSGTIPCTLTVNNVGADTTLTMYDYLQLRMYCVDSTGSGDTIKWLARWWARAVK